MPYGIGRTDEVEKALFLRQWGVPFGALAEVFGRDAMFWYRAWLSFGRPNLVGTTVKRAATCRGMWSPMRRSPGWMGAEVVVPPPWVGLRAGDQCGGASDSDSLQEAYGEFVTEAHRRLCRLSRAVGVY